MKSIGWEIRPLGWLALAVILGLVIYFVIRRLPPPPPKDAEKM